VKEFPLNDQEILLRLLHKTAHNYVDDYQASNGARREPTSVPV